MRHSKKELGDILSLYDGSFVYGKAVREYLMNCIPSRCKIVVRTPIQTVKKTFPTGRFARGKFRAVSGGCEYSFISSSADMLDICGAQDFTVNSAAYSPERGLIDKFGAKKDIDAKLVRFTQNESGVIYRNPLIMLKAVRICAELEFSLSSETESLIIENASRIRTIHPHKIAGELDRLLMTRHPEYVKMLHNLGMLEYILPQLEICFGEPQKNKYHIYDVGDHIIHTVQNTPRDRTLRWAALLHDIGKPLCSSTDSGGTIHFYGHHHESCEIADDILHRFGMTPEIIKDILILIENHDVRVDVSPVSVKRMMHRTGAELFDKLMALQTADNMAKNPEYFPEKYIRINSAAQIAKSIVEANEPFSYSQLAVNSRDIQKAGIRPGRETNEILRVLMDEVINDPSLNTRQYLLRRAGELHRL